MASGIRIEIRTPEETGFEPKDDFQPLLGKFVNTP